MILLRDHAGLSQAMTAESASLHITEISLIERTGLGGGAGFALRASRRPALAGGLSVKGEFYVEDTPTAGNGTGGA